MRRQGDEREKARARTLHPDPPDPPDPCGSRTRRVGTTQVDELGRRGEETVRPKINRDERETPRANDDAPARTDCCARHGEAYGLASVSVSARGGRCEMPPRHTLRLLRLKRADFALRH